MPRRRFQTGCVRIIGGQWVLYYWQDERCEGGIRRVKVSKRLGLITLSDREIARRKQDILNTVNNQTDIPVRDSNRSISLTEFIPEWRRLAAPHLKPSTLKGMESNIRAHILPMLGDKPLTSLDAKQHQELIVSLFTTLALTGLRSGEILGLYVEDLDFENYLIWIRRASWNGKIQTLKTAEAETSVPMTPLVKAKLLEHLKGHQSQLVFANRPGKPFNRGRVVKKILHPVLDRIGIPHVSRVGLHAFRHTLASLLIQTASALVAQRQLRHSDAKMTLEVYGHVLGSEHPDAMDRVESVLLLTSGT